VRDPVAYLAEHYVYEVNMLRATHWLLASAADQALANALIESFCVHARTLLDFFKSNPIGDDVVATHFVTAGHFRATATSQLSADVRTRVNKQVVHLTASRENAIKINDVDRLALLTAIEADHKAFKNAVDPQYANCFVGELVYIGVNGSVPSAVS